jgi:hypothetical protein
MRALTLAALALRRATAILLAVLLAAAPAATASSEVLGPGHEEIPVPSVVDCPGIRERIWRTPDVHELLEGRFARAILRSRQVQQVGGEWDVRWERCGAVVPDEQVADLAMQWAMSFTASLRKAEADTGMALPPWGAYAVHANESGFNECTLDFQTRRWAVKAKVVADLRLTYSNDDVWRILTSAAWAKAGRVKADLGPMQVRTATAGLTREQLDRINSVRPGLYLGLHNMGARLRAWQQKFPRQMLLPRPWLLWPGNNIYSARAARYDNQIIRSLWWRAGSGRRARRSNSSVGTSRHGTKTGVLGCQHKNN